MTDDMRPTDSQVYVIKYVDANGTTHRVLFPDFAAAMSFAATWTGGKVQLLVYKLRDAYTIRDTID